MSDGRTPVRPSVRLVLTTACVLGVGVVLVGTSAAADRRADGPGPAAPPVVAADGHTDHSHALEGADADPSGHAAAEGPVLRAAPEAEVVPGRGCRRGQPVRSYDVVALAVDITLNRYGDHDPDGRAYVLADEVDAVREQEQRAAAARAGDGPVPVTHGLQGDALQPLTLRVRPGECLRVALRNDLPDEPATFHLHGAALRVEPSGRPALQTEPAAVARPGRVVQYSWSVPRDAPEGSLYAHSHGDARDQTAHGLYAGVVVEPPGSRWLDPRTGAPQTSGWDAVVVREDGTAFREFAVYYAEMGDETEQPLDRRGAFVPLVDPITGAYKPAARLLSYRSEPFYDRLRLQQQRTGRVDESMAYSSYAFGDPATPMMRSYVGDPVVQRVVHAGAEALHVHHVHGGAVRWRRQPGVEDNGADRGLLKRPPLQPAVSERTDAQSLGPSEAFDAVAECGSGGCQQSVGDFLYHCHVAHHYFGGMWGLWRVYGTLQDGRASTDGLPPLLELPDRRGRVPAAVRASELVGTQVDLGTGARTLDAQDLDAWLSRVLPPPGRRRGYDAGVWDWVRSGQDVLGEPEDTRVWPGYASPTPGRRPQVLFDPRNGRPAYPLLRPHLGERAPFSPGHGPAPYLDPGGGGPGASGPASTCPTGTTPVPLPLKAIRVPVALSKRTGAVDPQGALFVRQDEEAAVRADPERRRPLVVRAAAQRDCVEVSLLSGLQDESTPNGLSKVDVHVHFMQFDVQGSDGVTAGYNYEQSVRPYRTASDTVAEAAPAGARALRVRGPTRFRPGESVAVGTERPAGPELVQVESVDGSQVRLRSALRTPVAAGELLTAEFVRYRWYPDAQFGTAYFHDHVNALSSWRHGLFGAIVVEPPDATWTSPTTGAPLRSGATADITTRQRVGHDVVGSFREHVSLLQDDNALTAVRGSTGGSMGLRVEPLAARGAAGPSRVYSDDPHGPPETAQVGAYLGDPVVFRTLVPGTNDVHTFHVDGHWFRRERWSGLSPPVAAVPLGISERYDLVVPAAGGPQQRPGDYLFGDGRTSKQREGVWGLLRVRPGPVVPELRPLAGRPAPPAASTGSVCPPDAPVREVALTAAPVDLPMLDGQPGAAFVPTSALAAVREGRRPITPLVLRARVGDCLRVTLTNALTDQRVSLHADLLAADPADGGGVAAGRMPDRSVAPGGTGVSLLYASPEVGETVALLRDQGDPVGGPSRGLYGAVVVAARGAALLDARTGEPLAPDSSAEQAVVRPPRGPAYRDAAVFLHDSDGEIGSHQMPYRRAVRGAVGLSYRSAPVGPRLERDADTSAVFRSGVHGDPATPVLTGREGDPLRLHVVVPVSEQARVVAVEGHRWPVEPGRRGTTSASATLVGALEAVTLRLDRLGAPGDYVYGDQRMPWTEAGLWGVLRVLPRDAEDGPVPLAAGRVRPALPAVGGVVLLLALLLWRRRRRSLRPVLLATS